MTDVTLPHKRSVEGAGARDSSGQGGAVVRALLLAQPLVAVPGSGLQAPHTGDVFDLWQRFEAGTGQVQAPPFWAVVWPGAALMASFLTARPQLVCGRVVLDVGCGSGLAGIAASVAGASRVIANDCDPSSVEAAQLCAGLNGVVLETSTVDFTLTCAPPEVDVILACELFYDGASARLLEQFLSEAAARGVRILLADGGRAFFPHARVQRLLTEELPAHLELEGVERRQVSIYEWVTP